MRFEGNLSEDEIKSIVEAIDKRTGMDFSGYAVSSLERGLKMVMHKVGAESSIELWNVIMRDRGGGILSSLVDDLTVNLTELFRNAELWQKISKDILEKKKGQSSIKILHAACSSGEEVYSMGMILKNMNMLNKSRLDAFDLSEKMLGRAKNANYPYPLSSKYIKAVEKQFGSKNLSAYFRENQDKSLTIAPDIRARAHFSKLNMIKEPFPGEKYDVIFCRNVLIYFDMGFKMQVIEKLSKALKDDGFLVIGYFDAMPRPAREIFTPYDMKTKIFIKNPNPGEKKIVSSFRSR